MLYYVRTIIILRAVLVYSSRVQYYNVTNDMLYNVTNCAIVVYILLYVCLVFFTRAAVIMR